MPEIHPLHSVTQNSVVFSMSIHKISYIQSLPFAWAVAVGWEAAALVYSEVALPTSAGLIFLKHTSDPVLSLLFPPYLKYLTSSPPRAMMSEFLACPLPASAPACPLPPPTVTPCSSGVRLRLVVANTHAATLPLLLQRAAGPRLLTAAYRRGNGELCELPRESPAPEAWRWGPTLGAQEQRSGCSMLRDLRTVLSKHSSPPLPPAWPFTLDVDEEFKGQEARVWVFPLQICLSDWHPLFGPS